MRIHLNRFLATSAVVCAAAALAAACTVVQENTSTDGGGVSGAGGTGGGTGGTAGQAGASGSAGTSGTAGASGTGGTAGASGTGGSAGADGGACYGDTATVDPTPSCGDLKFDGGFCSDGDGGTYEPTGVSFCKYLAAHGRPGVFDAYYQCVNAITAQDGCSTEYENAVQTCVDNTLGNTCEAPPYVFDGGSVSCADVAAGCPAVSGGTAGVTEQQCKDTIDGFNDATRIDIYYCFSNAAPQTGDCAEDFRYCAFSIDSYNGSGANDGG